MSAVNPSKPSGIKPPTSRLTRPVAGRSSISSESAGENGGRRPSEDLIRKKISDTISPNDGGSVDRKKSLREDEVVDLEKDSVSELPSLPGSRKTSEQRKFSDGSGSAVDAAYELARRLSEAGIRRMSEANIVLTADTDSFIIGDRVYVNGTKPGHIQFIGETKFAPGEWAGIVLDDLSGKNDGSVGGIRYFQCQPKRGVFSRLTRLTRQPLDAAQLASLQPSPSKDGRESTPVGDETADRESSPLRQTNSPLRQTSPSPSSVTPQSYAVSLQSIGDLRLGDRVIVTSSQGSKAGTLRYLGNADFATGQWAGVELDDPLGKNDGSVGGKRYFDCQPLYGLFAPVHKVTRSPANSMRRTSAAMNTSMTSTRPGLVRQGTRDSLGSAASVVSTASRTSTAPSRVRQHANPRLGVTSLTSNSPSHQKTSRGTTSTGSAPAAFQEILREKEQHIEQLLKEREMERSEVTRAAAQADEAEHQVALLKRKMKQDEELFQQEKQQMEERLSALESTRSQLASQVDDLQFRLEEETILRSELEVHQKVLETKEKELSKLLDEERQRAEQLEGEAQRSFESEEEVARYKDELDSVTNELNLSKNKISQLESKLSSSVSLATDVEGHLQQHLKELEEAIKVKTEELRKEEQERQKWKEEFHEISRNLEDFNQRYQAVNSRCENFVHEIEELKTKLSIAEETIKSQEEKLVASGKEIVQWKNEVDDWKNKYRLAEDQTARLTAEKSRIESELLQLSSSSSGASQNVARLHGEILEIRKTLSDTETNVGQLESEKSQLQTRIRALEQENSTLQSNLQAKEKLIADLRNAEEEYEKEIAALKKQENNLLTSVQQLESREQMTVENVTAMQKTIAALELENVQLVNDKAALQQTTAQLNKELLVLAADKEECRQTIKDRENRMLQLTEEVERLRVEFDAHRIELQRKLQETLKETEAVHELHAALEKARSRVEQLQTALEEMESEKETILQNKIQMESEFQSQVSSLKMNNEELSKRVQVDGKNAMQIALDLKEELQQLRDRLLEKEAQLREEMDDRDHLQDLVNQLRNQLTSKDKDVVHLREEITQLQQQTGELSQFKRSISSLEKEKRQLEEKLGEAQMKLSSNNVSSNQIEPDSELKELRKNYESSQREINFLNSVIVDMQKKVDDMKIKLEVSQASLLGQNITDINLNGIKTNTVAPRLFCDICDVFDLHDTEDCPKQASSDTEIPPVFLSTSSPAYTQHSHHGGKRGEVRPYCDNCEVFGHWTADCQEDSTF